MIAAKAIFYIAVGVLIAAVIVIAHDAVKSAPTPAEIHHRDPNQQYALDHSPCNVVRHISAGNPPWFDGSRVHPAAPGFTTFSCQGVEVYVNDVNGKPWRPE